ncbi:hypothetical protein EPN29_09330 [bacterium]|nr:MAG: hypothetical protein EPN29_09330 [bacterium]
MKRLPLWLWLVGAVVLIGVVVAITGIDPAYQFAIDVVVIALAGIVLAAQSARKRSTASAAELARFSPDMRWWWNGQAWQTAVSNDGRSRWDGRAWVPREYSSKVRNTVDATTYAITTFRNKRLNGWELQVMSISGRKFWRWISDARGTSNDFDLEGAHRQLVQAAENDPPQSWQMSRSAISALQSLVMELHPADSNDVVGPTAVGQLEAAMVDALHVAVGSGPNDLLPGVDRKKYWVSTRRYPGAGWQTAVFDRSLTNWLDHPIFCINEMESPDDALANHVAALAVVAEGPRTTWPTGMHFEPCVVPSWLNAIQGVRDRLKVGTSDRKGHVDAYVALRQRYRCEHL